MKRGYKQKRKKRPPKTIRYCVFCENMTTFVYNPNIGHSECKECGFRISKRVPPNDEEKGDENNE